MGKDFSQGITIGNLVDDPEMRLLNSGTPLTRFRVAVSDDYRSRDTGEWVSRTDFLSFIAWSNLAENVAEGCAKGDKIVVKWRPRNANYTDKDGKTVYKDDFVAETVQVLSRKSGGVRSDSSRGSSADSDSGAPF